MFKEIVGFVRENFGGAAQKPEETGPFAGLHTAHEQGVLGDVPFLPAFMQVQTAASSQEGDGYMLGEQTPVPPKLDPTAF